MPVLPEVPGTQSMPNQSYPCHRPRRTAVHRRSPVLWVLDLRGGLSVWRDRSLVLDRGRGMSRKTRESSLTHRVPRVYGAVEETTLEFQGVGEVCTSPNRRCILDWLDSGPAPRRETVWVPGTDHATLQSRGRARRLAHRRRGGAGGDRSRRSHLPDR